MTLFRRICTPFCLAWLITALLEFFTLKPRMVPSMLTAMSTSAIEMGPRPACTAFTLTRLLLIPSSEAQRASAEPCRSGREAQYWTVPASDLQAFSGFSRVLQPPSERHAAVFASLHNPALYCGVNRGMSCFHQDIQAEAEGTARAGRIDQHAWVSALTMRTRCGCSSWPAIVAPPSSALASGVSPLAWVVESSSSSAFFSALAVASFLANSSLQRGVYFVQGFICSSMYVTLYCSSTLTRQQQGSLPRLLDKLRAYSE